MNAYAMALAAVRERVPCFADTSTPHLFALISLLQDADQDVTALLAELARIST